MRRRRRQLAARPRRAPATTAAAVATDDRRRSDRHHRGGATDTTEAESTTPTEAETTDTSAAAGGGGEFGLIDGVYKGADDFALDPADCPEDWDPMQGITDTDDHAVLEPAQGRPVRRVRAASPTACKSYFKYINETNGGIDGRKITLDVKDDGYQPDKTKSNVDEALGQNKYAGC